MHRDPEPPIRPDGLQMEEHSAFQRRFWLAERVAWFGFVLIVGLAFAGATGAGGPLSRAVSEVAGARLDAPRIMRADRAGQIRVTLSAGAASIALLPGFGDIFRLEDVRPRPADWRGGARDVLDYGTGPVTVVLHVRALGPAARQLPIALNGQPATASVIILP